MARVGISYKQVENAVKELVGDGKQPTNRLIRALLGTGSPNTIQRHLTTWLNAQALASEQPALTATDQALKSEFDDIASETSQQSENIVEQVTHIERELHASEAVRIELVTAHLKIEAQAEKQKELIQENQHLRTALEASEQARQTAEQESAELRSRLSPAAMENENEVEVEVEVDLPKEQVVLAPLPKSKRKWTTSISKI